MPSVRQSPDPARHPQAYHLGSNSDPRGTYQPCYFLPKSEVDRLFLDRMRKHVPGRRPTAVPDETVEQCENSYEAADGKKTEDLA